MKQILMAGAAALACGAAGATPNLETYGRLDAGPAFETHRTTGNTLKSLNSSVWNPSMLGFRGQDDLGDGIKAVADMAGSVLTDLGASASTSKFFDRNAYVGLVHPVYGTVTFGRQTNTLTDVMYAVDPLAARASFANMNVRFGYLLGPGTTIVNKFGPTVAIAGANLDRVDNAAKYQWRSPTLGLSVVALAAAGEGVGGRADGFTLGYDRGQLVTRAAFMEYKDITGVPLKAWAAGAGYRVDGFTLRATYALNKIDSALRTTNQPYGDMQTQVGSVGVKWEHSLLVVNTSYQYGERTQDGAARQVAQKVFVVPEYYLSKNTSVALVTILEHFNKTGSALDTGTPLIAGTRSSLFTGFALDYAF